MPCLVISIPVWAQVLPEDGVPRDGLECHSHPLILLFIITRLLSALQKLAPSALFRVWHPDSGEFGSSTFTISLHIDIERRDTVFTSLWALVPVVMMLVIAPGSIPLGSQSLDMQIRVPALEVASPVLDTPHGIVALQQSRFRDPDIFSNGYIIGIS
jgi:hypothetical protein